MKVYRDLNSLPDFQQVVLTIGSFDGVHRGHQKILEQVKDLAKKVQGESLVITFHPHPRLVVYPKDNTLKLITTIDEKIILFERFGIDNLIIVPFTIEFSQQSADEYIEKFLIEKFNPRYIVIGYDHRFGLNRQGDINYLKHYSQKASFDVIEIQPQQIEEITISSTKIRKSISAGQMQKATTLLNHHFTITGTVVKGQQIGQEIGYPTANLKISSPYKLLPKDGIYAVVVQYLDKQYGGMLYIGSRPTLPAFNNKTIEVNIFDFNQKIYGKTLRLELLQFVRNDQQFGSLDLLKSALSKDKEAVLNILEQQPKGLIDRNTFDYPEVAVVILNYNGQKYLEEFLPSVLSTDYPNLRIVIADNGSTDDSIAFLHSSYSEKVEILDLKKNFGFAGGYNQALRQVHAPYYVLLNSDVQVSRDWLRPIVELFETTTGTGACQPKVLSYHNKNQFEYAGACGGWLDNLGYPFCRGRIFDHCEEDKGQYDQNQEVFWATGAAMVIKSDLYHQLGGLDSSYFAHMEEIDLCWRIKRAGFNVMVCTESKIYHVGGGTLNYQSPQKTYLNFRNSLVTLLKNETRSRLIWLIPLRLFLDGVAGFKFLLEGQFLHIWQIVRAHFYLYGNLGRIFKQRHIFSQLIEKARIGVPTQSGHYRKSILWQYYVLGRKRFSDFFK